MKIMLQQTRLQENTPNLYSNRMKTLFFSLIFLLIQSSVFGQTEGSWQGVLIQKNIDGTTDNYAVWAEFKSDRGRVTGKFRSEKANTPYYKVTALEGEKGGNKISFRETNIIKENLEEGFMWCFVIADLIYSEKDQKLKGSYSSSVKGCPPGELVLVKSNKAFNSEKTETIESASLENVKGLLEEKRSIIGKQFILVDVNFQSAKYKITSTSYVYLNQIGEILKEKESIKIHLKGNTDSDGDDENNFILSQKRAESVANYFINKGIDAARITFEGYGESRPITENITKEGKRANRRVELLIISE